VTRKIETILSPLQKIFTQTLEIIIKKTINISARWASGRRWTCGIIYEHTKARKPRPSIAVINAERAILAVRILTATGKESTGSIPLLGGPDDSWHGV